MPTTDSIRGQDFIYLMHQACLCSLWDATRAAATDKFRKYEHLALYPHWPNFLFTFHLVLLVDFTLAVLS